VPENKECPGCKGKGTVNGGFGNQVNCSVCGGKKYVIVKDDKTLEKPPSTSGWPW
jgi:DnaJ-class molecular chaperone